MIRGINDTRVLETPAQRLQEQQPLEPVDGDNDGTIANVNNNDNNADANDNGDNNHLHQDWSKMDSWRQVKSENRENIYGCTSIELYEPSMHL